MEREALSEMFQRVGGESSVGVARGGGREGSDKSVAVIGLNECTGSAQTRGRHEAGQVEDPGKYLGAIGVSRGEGCLLLWPSCSRAPSQSSTHGRVV